MNRIITPLNENQYYHTQYTKKQIVLHHTVSNGNAKNVINWWNQHPQHIATPFVIDREGKIHQCFDENKWAHHIGLKSPNNRRLNQQSIGIELCSWGGLKKFNNRYYSVFGSEVPEEQVEAYKIPYRGFLYFQKYSAVQLESLEQLLIALSQEHGIPTKYNPEMWDLYAPATSGSPGIYTHTSYRQDKSDCHPQPEIIQVLTNLENKK